MFCGEGKSSIVTDLKIRSFAKCEEDKDQVGLLLSSEKKSCECLLNIVNLIFFFYLIM